MFKKRLVEKNCIFSHLHSGDLDLIRQENVFSYDSSQKDREISVLCLILGTANLAYCTLDEIKYIITNDAAEYLFLNNQRANNVGEYLTQLAEEIASQNETLRIDTSASGYIYSGYKKEKIINLKLANSKHIECDLSKTADVVNLFWSPQLIIIGKVASHQDEIGFETITISSYHLFGHGSKFIRTFHLYKSDLLENG